uniref:E3 ubiquitin-protein ligase UBR7 n=1 Tax=Cacopsylla melanoneura TaxID=428564 RepID=A0A8D8RW95_9HEMI
MADEEGTITLGEVLALQDHLEESAVAVLGAADDKNCMYSEGYIKRQALYACLTCTPDVCDPAGFCLACNYHCHEGHNIVELYTKRNFRCDCGNSKFGDKKCNLEPVKDAVNVNNIYNQNFKGKYCSCSRPYPDDENPNSDEMIQCALCEDWYHTGHLGNDTGSVPSAEEYCEMCCASCVNKYPVLKLYPQLLVKETKEDDGAAKNETDSSEKSQLTPESSQNGDNNPEKFGEKIEDSKVVEKETEVDKSTGCDKASASEIPSKDPSKQGASNGGSEVAKEIATANNKPDEEEVDIETVKPKDCLIKGQDLSSVPPVTKALFWEEGWRAQLCKCDLCLNYYNEHKIGFITDLTDMVEVFEKKNVADTAPPNPDADLAFLSTLDRVQQVEIISEYNDMKEKLVEYLKQFGEEKKVVKAEDIHKFFSNLQDCKRRRLNDDVPAPPGFCR